MHQRKILKIVLVGFFALVLLLALLLAAFNWSGQRAWQKMEAELRAKGEPTRFAEIIPPPIPDEQNFAFSPLFAGVFEMENQIIDGQKLFVAKYPEARSRLESYALAKKNPPLPPTPDLKKEEPVDLVVWQKYLRKDLKLPPSEQTSDLAGDVILALNQKAPLDEVARELRASPFMRAPLYYERGLGMSIPHLSVLQSLAKLYQLRAIAFISQRNAVAASEDIHTIALLNKATESGQTLIGYLIAITLDNIQASAIREGLAAHIWNDAQIQEIGSFLHPGNRLQEISQALRFERVVFIEMTRRGRVPDLFSNVSSVSDAFKYVPQGIWDNDRLYYCRLMQRELEDVFQVAAGRVSVAQSAALKEEVENGLEQIPARFLHILTGLAFPVLNSIDSNTAENVATLDEIRLALALERYRLAKGSLPDNLIALAPDYLSQIPMDPIDGQPLRYQKTGDDSYKIWSIGWNEKDDGGTRDKDRQKGDWVWTSLPSK